MKRSLRTASGMLAVLGCALWIGVSAASAASAPTFTLDVQPEALTAGNSAALVATFTNKDVGVSGVGFTITFPFAVTVARGDGCASLRRFPNTVLCVIGLVGAGQTATKSFQFAVPSDVTGPVTVKGTAGFLSPRPPRVGLIPASWTGTSYAPGRPRRSRLPAARRCSRRRAAASTRATAEHEPRGLRGEVRRQALGDCGGHDRRAVRADRHGRRDRSGDNTAMLFFKASEGQDLTIDLTFPDEQLPGSGDHPGPLKEWPNYPDTSTDVLVPTCGAGGAIPVGSDACIVSVDTSLDPDGDADAGTITVHAIGTAGDGGFHPG